MRYLNFLLWVAFAGCAAKNDAPKSNLPHAAVRAAGATECYRYAENGDTLLLQLRSADTLVTGEFYTQYNGKNRDIGIIKGMMLGDTLFASYHFQSEVVWSYRAVVFLHRGETMVEGFGPTDQQQNGLQFTAGGQIIFSGDRVLEAVPCT